MGQGRVEAWETLTDWSSDAQSVLELVCLMGVLMGVDSGRLMEALWVSTGEL